LQLAPIDKRADLGAIVKFLAVPIFLLNIFLIAQVASAQLISGGIRGGVPLTGAFFRRDHHIGD
jgi:hypothetical protein